MRHYQRGIATVIILVLFLIVGVAIASAVFIFYQNLPIKPVINSFEDCAKLYPVMESHPTQCNTPDGRHFVQELSEEEKRRLVPPKLEDSTNSGNLDETANWKTYTNSKFSFSVNYPPSLKLTESFEETELKQSFNQNNRIKGSFGFLNGEQPSAWGFYITTESIEEVINRTNQEIASRQRLIQIKDNTTEDINGNRWNKLVWLSDYGNGEGVDYLISNGKVTIVLNCGPEAELDLCKKTIVTFRFLQ